MNFLNLNERIAWKATKHLLFCLGTIFVIVGIFATGAYVASMLLVIFAIAWMLFYKICEAMEAQEGLGDWIE